MKKCDLMTGETYSLVWGKVKERTKLVRLTKILFMDSFDKIRKGQRERERERLQFRNALFFVVEW